MNNDTLALTLGSFVLAHGAILWSAIRWGFTQVLNYKILIKDFDDMKLKVQKLEQDINFAHKKLREK